MKYILMVWIQTSGIEKYTHICDTYNEVSELLAGYRKMNLYAYQLYKAELIAFYGGL
jgi:hypothetical protein